MAELAERLIKSQEAPSCPTVNDSNQRRSLADPSSDQTAVESATPTGDEIQDDVIPATDMHEHDQNEDKENNQEIDKEDDVQKSLELYTRLE